MKKVLQKLKPKAVSLGFSKEELEVVAKQVEATLPEDATEEQIDAAVDAAIPFLKVSQTAVNRIVNAKKEEKAPAGSDPEPEKGGDNPKKKDDDEPGWFKAYREQQEERLNRIEQGNVSKTRRTLFEEKIKDLPEKHKASMLKDFDRIGFKDDDDFDSYLSEKETDINDLNQELANAGLSKMKRPGAGGDSKTEIDEFAEKMKEINEKKET